METTSVKLKHNRFNGFDIYTAEIKDKPKMLFHKLAETHFIVAETFKYLGSNNDLWLCENIHNKMISIGHFSKFKQLESIK